MKRRLIAFALLALAPLPARAHRLDEYLQATILSIESGRVKATVRLVPGVAVSSAVVASIDSNNDGVLSVEEQRRYAQQVLADLRLKEDSRVLPLHLLSATFPSIDHMKQGTGEIELTFSAERSGSRGKHVLAFENRHQSGVSVYLVNSLIPQDTNLALGTQSRNQNESFYQVDYTEARGPSIRTSTWSGFEGAFRLGARHIAEGTDHLLFLLTLLLPAPLLAFHGRWSGRATIRRSLTHILGIVTAFTLGHSLTLALSGMGFVRVPGQPVEILIAISILVSAIHAIWPIFPGREAFVAAFFGLIHGLAFASALNELGVTGWYRVLSLFGFNVGIEAMQLAVVSITLPALLTFSRTPLYAAFRISGAGFASVASCSWIFERVLNRPNSIGYGIERLAHHGVLLCVTLWACSALAWLSHRQILLDSDSYSSALETLNE